MAWNSQSRAESVSVGGVVNHQIVQSQEGSHRKKESAAVQVLDSVVLD